MQLDFIWAQKRRLRNYDIILNLSFLWHNIDYCYIFGPHRPYCNFLLKYIPPLTNSIGMLTDSFYGYRWTDVTICSHIRCADLNVDKFCQVLWESFFLNKNFNKRIALTCPYTIDKPGFKSDIEYRKIKEIFAKLKDLND